MRIAFVSPYSWTYPGGVTRHIEALADELRRSGHDARILTPFDPDDRRSRRLHRGAAPQARELPDHVVPLGRTIGLPANGAVSNVTMAPSSVLAMRAELRSGGYDVVHIHEPVAWALSWDAMGVGLPLVGTFHCYSENVLTNNVANLVGARWRLNRLHVRIAVSQAAAWTGERFFGGRYRIIPNGVDVEDIARLEGSPQAAGHAEGEGLRVLFVGQAVERKGLPILLRAFEALREQLPTSTLTLVGANAQEIAPMVLDDRGIRALGKVSEAEKVAQLARADVVCAPSLGGESFGMVLTEAFAAATPVVASDIPGYRDVVRDGIDGMLVAPGDPLALAQALRTIAEDPRQRSRMADSARERARRFAWPRVAEEVLGAYEDAVAVGHAATRARRFAVRRGYLAADLLPRVPANTRLASLAPTPVGGRIRRIAGIARTVTLAAFSIVLVWLAVIALGRIGVTHVAASLVSSKPGLIGAALGAMCASMIARAVAWRAILRAAPTWREVTLRDALQGTFIGVLMSATLPARLGEPARGLIVARRLGRAREMLPIVVGTMVSQTLLNLLALCGLGVAMFSSVSSLDGHDAAVMVAALAPVAVIAVIVFSPIFFAPATVSRSARFSVLTHRLRSSVIRVRDGLRVFSNPRQASIATVTQLGAWGLQWMSCWVLLMALGLDGRVGAAGAAAVLFAVNVTAVIPATPANVGVFQAACVAVLAGAYHVGSADALAYGIILQAVEISTAVAMGMPALVKEGLSWREVRLRAVHAAPVSLAPLPASGRNRDALRLLARRALRGADSRSRV